MFRTKFYKYLAKIVKNSNLRPKNGKIKILLKILTDLRVSFYMEIKTPTSFLTRTT